MKFIYDNITENYDINKDKFYHKDSVVYLSFIGLMI